MKKFFASHFFSRFVITVFILCSVTSCVKFSAQCSDISSKVLRLHILANSDSEYDQRIKLLLRDEIIKNSSTIIGHPLTKNDAICVAEDRLDAIQDFCNRKLRSLGSKYTTDCEVVNMYFNTRTYGDKTMPAGFYDALRIKIGKGEGKNWWCVLFPPICLSGAIEEKEVFNDDDEKILEKNGDYEFQFKIVEIFDYIRSLA